MGKTFKFKDLMVSIGGAAEQAVPLCLCATRAGSICFCLSQQGTLCQCISNQISCQCLSHAGTCICVSHPATCACVSHPGTCFCGSHALTCGACSIAVTCICVSQQGTFCQCISDNIASVCGPLSGGCGAISGGCGVSFDPGPEQQVENLATLKEQLKQALVNLEKQEQAVNESLKPQTVAEADELHQKLQGALEELKAHRETLARKEKK
jgi:hypothetical protein